MGLWTQKPTETIPQPLDLREKARNRHLRRVYGITSEQYERMSQAQNHRCAICGEAETSIGGRHGDTPLRLAVDHDHETGEVRGLLCSCCNQAIGMLRHDAQLLTAAIRYLQQYERSHVWKTA